ncbi:MAG: PHP domain-containing protein [Patescibacteria group bacterium]
MIRLDLHTHSNASPDGGISAAQYHKVLSSGLLDCIAITDHNRIDFALEMQQAYGERIIVGEEIMTSAGEIIGLFLEKKIRPGLSPEETIDAIDSQNGIVYIPHPFETLRKGLDSRILDELKGRIDIIEVYNGRALVQNRSQQAAVWAKLNTVPSAASSDAHGIKGLGKTFTGVAALPTKKTLVDLLISSTPIVGRPSVRALIYPKYYRLRKKLIGGTP